MIILYLLIFYMISLSLFIKNSEKMLWLYLIILFMLLSFRYGVGTDYFSYELIYDRVHYNPIYEIKIGTGREEILFRFLLSVCKYMGISFQGIIVITSFIVILFLYKIINEYSNYKIESLLLFYSIFYFVWGMSGIRQGITMVIGTYYLLKMMNKEINEFHYMIIITMLYLIHRSSIILLFILLFNRDSFKKIILIALYVSFALSIFKFNPILKIIANSALVKKTSFNYIGIGFGLDKQTIFRLPFLLLVFLTQPKNAFETKQKNAIFLTYIIYFMFKSSELVAARFLVYGWMVLVIYLPNNLYRYKINLEKLTKKFVLVFLMFLFFINQVNVVYSQITYFEKESGIKVNRIKYISVFNKNNYSFSKKLKYERL